MPVVARELTAAEVAAIAVPRTLRAGRATWTLSSRRPRRFGGTSVTLLCHRMKFLTFSLSWGSCQALRAVLCSFLSSRPRDHRMSER